MRILYIEDSPVDARLVKELLKEAHTPFNLFFADSISSGTKRLSEGDIDVVLLDLFLPDSKGLDTFYKIQRLHMPSLPIVVVSVLDSEDISIKAVQEGAQDYLIKGQFNGLLLVHVLRYAIERHSLLQKVRELALIDELTGLYNRRGFVHIAEQQLKLAQRLKNGMLLIFADLDGLKKINDTLGHKEGDMALIDVAHIMKETFRDEDIIARLSDDEFVVLALESTECNEKTINTRLQQNLATHNESGRRKYMLVLNLGVVCFDSKSPSSVDKLLDQAEELMYKQKVEKDNAGKK